MQYFNKIKPNISDDGKNVGKDGKTTRQLKLYWFELYWMHVSVYICYSKTMFILTGKYLLSFINFLSPNWVAVEFAKSPSKYK